MQEPSSGDAQHITSVVKAQVGKTVTHDTLVWEQGGEHDIRWLFQLIQALPTKDDIQTLMLSVTGALKVEIDEIRTKVAELDGRAGNWETRQSTIDPRLEVLEEKSSHTKPTINYVTVTI